MLDPTRPYRLVLQQPGIARLAGASLLARLPIGMIALAIILSVSERTGSFAIAGAAMGAFSVGAAVLAPWRGRLTDRRGVAASLTPLAALHAAALGGLVVALEVRPETALIVALAALAGASVPPMAASMRALWPQVLSDRKHLDSAYALDATGEEAAFVLAPLVVTALVLIASPTAALATTAALILVGTLGFARAAPVKSATSPHRRSVSRGERLDPAIFTVVGVIALVDVGLGFLSLGLPALASESDLGTGVVGAFFAAFSLGSLIGGLWYGAHQWAVPVATRYLRLTAALALAATPLPWISGPVAVSAAVFLVGLAVGPSLACAFSLLESATPAGRGTESFAWITTANAVGLGVGEFLAGVLSEELGARAALSGTAIAALVGAAFLLIRRSTILQATTRSTVDQPSAVTTPATPSL